jgi:hypothetical protein
MKTFWIRITIGIIIQCLTIIYVGHAQQWFSYGAGLSQSVRSVELYKGSLYVGGDFNSAGGMPAKRIAKWDGQNWASIASEFTGSHISSFFVFKDTLFAGGSFSYIDTVTNSSGIAKWNGINWQSAGSHPSDSEGDIYSMIEFQEELYVAGNLTRIGGINVNRIAKWDGNSWKKAGSGVWGAFEDIMSLAVYNEELYAGGNFTVAGGKQAYNIAKWDGEKWNSVGSGLNNYVTNLVVDSMANVLYVSGPFTMAGGKPVRGVAKWNGFEWAAVGDMLVSPIVIYHNKLYGSCNLGDLGGFNKWTGTNWETENGGANLIPLSYKVYNDTLYLGGFFTHVGPDNLPANRVAAYYSPPEPCDSVKADLYFEVTDYTAVFWGFSENGENYFWDFGDGNKAGLKDPVHHYDSVGTYTIQLVVTNGCSRDTVVQLLDVGLGIEGLKENKNSLKIFPNPSNGDITIEPAENFLLKEVVVYDLSGRVVRHVKVKDQLNNLKISDLPKGTFILKFVGLNSKKYISKLIVN